MTNKAELFQDKPTALKRAQYLTKKNKESYMAYEYPDGKLFSVIKTSFFKKTLKDQGYVMEKFGEVNVKGNLLTKKQRSEE